MGSKMGVHDIILCHLNAHTWVYTPHIHIYHIIYQAHTHLMSEYIHLLYIRCDNYIIN